MDEYLSYDDCASEDFSNGSSDDFVISTSENFTSSDKELPVKRKMRNRNKETIARSNITAAWVIYKC